MGKLLSKAKKIIERSKKEIIDLGHKVYPPTLLADLNVTQKSSNYLEYLFSSNPSLLNIINNLRNKSSHPLVITNLEE